MTEIVKVARVSDIAPGERLWLEFEEETVVLFNINGRFYCIADVCTHDGGPLDQGQLQGDVIECPRHGARFSVRTGKVLALPAVKPLNTYPLRVEGSEIQVAVP